MSIGNVKKALIYGTDELKMSNITSARLDAELLLAFVLGVSREKLTMNQESRIKNQEWKKYNTLIKKRKENCPIAYLTNKKEFYGIDFFVDENVLVPRPETETLVEEVIKYCRGVVTPPRNIGRGNRAPTILEIGTGSGCIALTLARYLPKAKITAVDISEKALKVARKNFKRIKQKNNATIQQCNNIHFKHSDLLSNIKPKPDIIVANLPYLTLDELKEPSITKEPRMALYGGREGLVIYEKLFKQIQERKWERILLFLEINPNQKSHITKIGKKYFPDAVIEVKKDLAKKDRVVIINI